MTLSRKPKAALIQLVVEQQRTINQLKEAARKATQNLAALKPAKRKYLKLEEAEVVEIKKMLNQNMTLKEIAKKVKRHTSTIASIRRQKTHSTEGGLILRPYTRRGRHRKALQAYHRKEIFDKYWTGGKSIQEIAEEYDISENYVYKLTAVEE